MKNFLLFFFLLIYNITNAQITLQISDQESKENIPFVSVLLPEHKKSFVTDEHGKFTIDTHTYKLPLKILVEQFRFDPQTLILQNNVKVYNIYLNTKSELLHEIIIPPKNAKIKERIFGRTNEGSVQMQGESSYYNQNSENADDKEEFGMIINTNNKLKKVKKIHWHLNKIDFKKAFFSIQFYEIKNGKPSKKIPHQPINFVLSEKNTGWNVINIDKFDFYFNHKKIAAVIKIQKIEFKKGKTTGSYVLNIGLSVGNSVVGRDSQYEDWTKIPANFPFYITVDSYE